MSFVSAATTSQVKVTIPKTLHDYLRSRAEKYGLTVTAYVKNLIIDDVKEMDVPVFPMSEKREKIGQEALKEHKQGKTKKIDDIGEYLDKL